MLYFDSINVSEGIDVNKTSALKKCNICHYWYFLHKGFKFQPNVCNRCHDLLMMFIKFSNIIFKIKGSNYRFVLSIISRNEAINLMKISISSKKSKR